MTALEKMKVEAKGKKKDLLEAIKRLRSARGDSLPSPRSPSRRQTKKSKTPNIASLVKDLNLKSLFGYDGFGSMDRYSGGEYSLGYKKGGSIKKAKKKKKRVVRGVGAAKRGYGKATYSKKMY